MIRIKDIVIYHPDNKIGNDVYLENNEKHRHFLEDILRKKERYIVSEDENVVTMMLSASKKILAKTHLTGEDVDIVVAVSQTPEYFAPPVSAIIHHHLGVKEESCYYDLNVACMGMNFAFQQCSEMLKNNINMNRALIVCCDLNSLYIDNDSSMYGNCGDLSCAMIIEKDLTNQSSIIDTLNYSASNQIEYICMPQNGFSSLKRGSSNISSLKFAFDNNSDARADLAIKYIEKILENNNLKAEDISMFCFSQFIYPTTLKLREHFNIPTDKSLYIGDQYGYTGGSSPFVVFHEAIKKDKIKRGDYVLFWTVGTGVQGIVTIIKY